MASSPELAREHILNEARTMNRSVVILLDSIVMDAHVRGASDIHINPGRSTLEVRLRVDGHLTESYELPLEIHSECIARLKILSGLRTDEHALPQDGKYSAVLADNEEVSVRISIVPTQYGENAVLRLLPSRTHKETLETLGMSEEEEKLLARALSHMQGLVLVTGPTGSGKTTTLYTILLALSKNPVSVVSIEDPVEYSLPQVTQVQVQQKGGLTFTHGLRSLLRQDPDVIMVGEMRDTETAQLACTAALTGHLVISSLHTNDARSSIPRLLEMGIEPYVLSSTLRVVVAQRLVRKNCVSCAEIRTLSSEEYQELSVEFGDHHKLPKTYTKSNGCEKCLGTGFQGRIGIFEVLPCAEEVKNQILSGNLSGSSGHAQNTLLEDGLQKVALGLTTFEELLRIRHA